MLLGQLLPVQVSPTAIWLWVQQGGQRVKAWLEKQLQALAEGKTVAEAETLDEATLSLPMVVGADGVFVPFRPNDGNPEGRTKWREVKVGILARLKRYTNRKGKEVTRLEQRRLVAVLGDINALACRLKLEGLWQGLPQTKIVVWISDGARGLWGLFETHFSGRAQGILDFYHAAQNLWKGIKPWKDGRTKQARQWFETARHKLRHGQQDDVLADLAAALDLEDLPDTAHEALTKLYNYLDKHQDHIQYANFKALGLPLGSGMVESACKWLIQQRFKGVGMRWSEDGFNHLLHLRLAWVNDRFDTFFPLGASP